MRRSAGDEVEPQPQGRTGGECGRGLDEASAPSSCSKVRALARNLISARQLRLSTREAEASGVVVLDAVGGRRRGSERAASESKAPCVKL